VRPLPILLTTRELAKHLGITPSAVNYAAREGRLPVAHEDAYGRLFDLAQCRNYTARRKAT
jgi:DNA-binding transcriptional MerR regulator